MDKEYANEGPVQPISRPLLVGFDALAIAGRTNLKPLPICSL